MMLSQDCIVAVPPRSMFGAAEPECEPGCGEVLPSVSWCWADQALVTPLAPRLPVSPDWLLDQAPDGLRVYNIWRFPSRPDLVGVWTGALVGLTAWRALLLAEPSGQYCGSRLVLKKYSSLREALAAWPRDGPRETRQTTAPALYYHF